MKERATPSKWYREFIEQTNNLILGYKANGYTIKGVTMTSNIYHRVSKSLGYEPDNINGYMIFILHQTQEEFDKEGDIFFIECEALN